MVTLDAAHTYHTADGRTVPGVTDILSAVLGDQWAGRTTEYHLARGQAAHAVYAILGRGEDVALYDIDPALDGHVRQWREWASVAKPEFTEIELAVHSARYDYAGTLDAVALIRGKRTILDYKATATRRDVWQMAAYAEAYAEQTGIFIGQAIGVQITADSWRMSEPVRGVEWERAKRQALAARTVYGMIEAEGKG
jgi:hypothetical protein